jgi:CspA family cold shock protein
MAMGKVKWFDPTKGYGFIQPDGGGADVFVCISAVEKAGNTSLAEGAKISYELVTGRGGKVSAENCVLAEGRPAASARLCSRSSVSLGS